MSLDRQLSDISSRCWSADSQPLTMNVADGGGAKLRADLADLVKADLFLSVHFNSSTNAKSHGFELYYLDNGANAAAAKVAKSENLNLKGEELIVNEFRQLAGGRS